MLKKTVLIAFSLVLLLTAGIAWKAWQFVNTGASQKKKSVVYEVVNGSTFKKVANDLQQQGVITNALFFEVYARLIHQDNKVKVGEYGLDTQMKPLQVLKVITSGKSIGRTITLKEGLNIFEIGDIFERAGVGTKQEFLRWARDKQFISNLLKENVETAEGYLFPETYTVTKYMSVKDVIIAMVKRFESVYAEVEPNIEIKGLNRHQIITLASIIEKETGAPEERRIISSVFHNRLNKKMRLQTDPTVIYGVVEQTGQSKINITKKDLLTPTRYNTYSIFGLPPGPIANPGREALLAAVSPEDTPYLFFVSQNNGTHIFTETYEEHSKAVRTYQMNPKMRQGKSWRDLKTNK